jgi:hypothetical protein
VTPLAKRATEPGYKNDDGYKVTAVTSGPNTGLWYVTSVSYRMDIQSNINPTIKQGSNFVYNLTDAEDLSSCNSVPYVNYYDYNTKCRSYSLAPFYAALWNHEGRGSGTNNGHQAQLELAGTETSLDVHRYVEGVFGENANATRAQAVNVVAVLAQLLSDRWVDHRVVQGNWCGSLWQFDRDQKKFVFVPLVEDLNKPCL